jgi:hypothetical protein
MSRSTSLLFLLVAASALAACGDDVRNDPTSSGVGAAGATGAGGSGGDVVTASGTGATGGATGGAGVGGSPAACVEPEGTLLAASKIYWGDKLPDGASSANAWKQYGFDIDGLVTTVTSTDVCKPAAGGSVTGQSDGNAGIDNSFGSNIVPMLSGVAVNFSEEANSAITTGQFTFMLQLAGLTAGDTASPVPTGYYAGAPMGESPKFDGTDCWPVSSESLSAPPDLATTKASFPTASVASNVWSSNGTAEVFLLLPAGGVTMELHIHHARFSAILDADHAGATLGLIGGVIDREELVQAVADLAGAFSPDLCTGTTVESIKNQIRQAADILKDGTQDPTKECDGISIGLGFDLEQVKFGAVADPPPPPPDPCP